MTARATWCGISDCSACGIRQSALFARLEADELTIADNAIEACHHQPEGTLYQIGGRADAVYTIRSGWVKLVRYLPDGGYRIVRIAGGGDVIGLEAMLGNAYLHDAIVLQPAHVCRIPIEVLNRLAEKAPGLHQELMARWHRALDEADTWLTELSTGAARQRVMRLLLKLTDENGHGKAPLLGRKDMGAVLGVTTESVSRAVAALKRAGLLYEGGGEFRCIRGAIEQKLGSD